MQINIKRHTRNLGFLAVIMLLTGCASNVVVKGSIPEPLVEKLPLTGSLSYTEEFKNYTYVESHKKRRGVLVGFDFKDVQVSMFDRIFGALLSLDSSGTTKTDLIIEPQVLDFQYSTPAETQTTQYEVWIKYRLQIMDGDRQTLADWVIKGYGKTPTAMLQSTSAGFNSAANVAMRDIGAQLAIRFPRQQSVQDLVAEKGGVPLLSGTIVQQTDASVETAQSLEGPAQGLEGTAQSAGQIVETAEEAVIDAQQALEQAEDAAPTISEE